MEVLFEDIKRSLDAAHVSLPDTTASQPEVDAQSTDIGPKLPPLAETRPAQLNRQLEVSREVELALREMRMSDNVGMKQPAKVQNRTRLKKDVPDSVQATLDLKNTNSGLSDRSRSPESGIVR